MPTQNSFLVVGAGLGGLATALRLAHLGHDVTVLEKTDQVGGRNRTLKIGGASFDAGPTLVMMLDPFRKLFRDVGERLEDHLELTLCDPGYRVFFSDGARIEGTTDVDRMVRQIEALSGEDDARAYPRLLADLKSLYESAIPNFVAKNFYSPLDFFSPRALRLVAKHRMLGNLAKGIARYFDDPRARMLFSFQTLYLGLSPFEAPWVYAVLTYMEYGEGIWYPKRGVAEICQAVARLAVARGAEIRLNSPVCRIDGNSVLLESGERLTADAVICNADLPYAEQALVAQTTPEGSPSGSMASFAAPQTRGHVRLRDKSRRYSCSAFMLYVDYAGQLPDLLHHNVFFGADFQGNLEDIFNRGRLPEDPAFYACISSRSEPDKAAIGHENLYVLVPCPNLDHPWSDADAEALTARVFARLTKAVGFDPALVVAKKTYTPIDWRDELNLDRGAAFGLSHHFNQSAYFRPANRSRANPKLFYVGASTTPGNGLPMVLISADLVVDRLKHDGFLEAAV